MFWYIDMSSATEPIIMVRVNAKLSSISIPIFGNADGAALVEFNKYMSSLNQMLAVAEKKLTNVSARYSSD
jgi:hypothetical protein